VQGGGWRTPACPPRAARFLLPLRQLTSSCAAGLGELHLMHRAALPASGATAQVRAANRPGGAGPAGPPGQGQRPAQGAGCSAGAWLGPLWLRSGWPVA
jgi:hypothetical protein